MFLLERVSNWISSRISAILGFDKDHEEILAYGAFNLFQTIWSIFWIIVIAAIFKVLVQAMVVTFTVSILRKYSGGVHATSPNRCTIIGTFICVGLALLSNTLEPSNANLWISTLYVSSFLYSYYIICSYAPVDSPSKRIATVEARKRFKICSILTISFLLVISSIIFLIYLKIQIAYLLSIIECICFGITWQSTTLTKFGYNVLTRIDYVLKRLTRGN